MSLSLSTKTKNTQCSVLMRACLLAGILSLGQTANGQQLTGTENGEWRYLGGDAGNPVALTQNALAFHVGEWGRIFVSIALLLFAFSSIMYNYYLGEKMRFAKWTRRKVPTWVRDEHLQCVVHPKTSGSLSIKDASFTER